MKTYQSTQSLIELNNLRKNSSNSLSFYENNKDKRLERNRESARNSRKRKKIYIEMLENKVFSKKITKSLKKGKGEKSQRPIKPK